MSARIRIPELRDGLILAAAALVVLPLLPSRPLELLGGLSPRPLATLALLIMAMQAAGQAALNRLGQRGGILLSGFALGFISSTASIASLGNRAREQPGDVGILAGAGAASAAATWVQALLMSAVLSPGSVWPLAPTTLVGAFVAAGCAIWLAGRQPLPTPMPLHVRKGSALRPREALMVVLLLAGVSLLIAKAQRHLGDTSAGIGIALAGLLDAHAPIASLAALHAAGQLSEAHWIGGVLVAISANTLTRVVVAGVAGGAAFARRVGAALLISLALAWLMACWTLLS